MRIATRIVSIGATLFWILLVGCGINIPPGGNPDGGNPGTDGGSGPCAVTVNTDITSPTTWSHSTAVCDYLVDGQINVTSALVIQPSVVVRFTAHSLLDVTPTGSLHAVGTSTTPIVFSSTASKGYWGSLTFESNDPLNELTYAQVTYGGDTSLFSTGAEITVPTGGKLKLTHSNVSQSGSRGLLAGDGAFLDGFSTNVFSANTKAPVTVSLAGVAPLDSTSDYTGGASPNAELFVGVTDNGHNNAGINQTWQALNVPYLLSVNVSGTEMSYGGALTIMPGTKLMFEADSGLFITETGSLNATGTAVAPIVFTGKIQSVGYWKGLVFRSSTGNVLDHTEVSYGGSSTFCCSYGSKSNLTVGDTLSVVSAITLTNSTVSFSGGYGYNQMLGGTLTQSGNTFTSNTLGNNP